VAHVITSSCCNDAVCAEVCPVDCIHPTPNDPDYGSAEMLYINPTDCIDCEACLEVCPVDAIHRGSELPDHLTIFIALNAAYFESQVPV